MKLWHLAAILAILTVIYAAVKAAKESGRRVASAEDALQDTETAADVAEFLRRERLAAHEQVPWADRDVVRSVPGAVETLKSPVDLHLASVGVESPTRRWEDAGSSARREAILRWSRETGRQPSQRIDETHATMVKYL